MEHWKGEVFYSGELQDHDDFRDLEAAQRWAEAKLEAAGNSIQDVEWKCSGNQCELVLAPGIEARLTRQH